MFGPANPEEETSKLSHPRTALRDSREGDLQSADLILAGNKAVDSDGARSEKNATDAGDLINQIKIGEPHQIKLFI